VAVAENGPLSDGDSFPFLDEYFHSSPQFRALYSDSLPHTVASVTSAVPVMDMYAGEDHSWQDVYASYGCSLDFDVSDDDG